MSTGEFVKNLQQVGLTEREARLYLGLLEKEEATAAELHRISGVNRSKTYELLENLINRGFAKERLEGRHRHFRAVPPKELKQIVISGLDAEINHRKNLAGNLFDTLDKQYSPNLDASSLDNIEVLRSRPQIHQRYLKLLNETFEEVLTFNRSPYAHQNAVSLKQQEDALDDMYERNVKFRTIYMFEEDTAPWLTLHIQKCKVFGEKQRITNFLPLKMFISDRETVLFALKNSAKQKNSDFTMLAVKDKHFASSMLELFDLYWSRTEKENEWKEKMESFIYSKS